MPIAPILVAAYFVVGTAISMWFAFHVAPRLDPSVRGSGRAFRLVLTLSGLALWPAELVLWKRVRREVPT